MPNSPVCFRRGSAHRLARSKAWNCTDISTNTIDNLQKKCSCKGRDEVMPGEPFVQRILRLSQGFRIFIDVHVRGVPVLTEDPIESDGGWRAKKMLTPWSTMSSSARGRDASSYSVKLQSDEIFRWMFGFSWKRNVNILFCQTEALYFLVAAISFLKNMCIFSKFNGKDHYTHKTASKQHSPETAQRDCSGSMRHKKVKPITFYGLSHCKHDTRAMMHA